MRLDEKLLFDSFVEEADKYDPNWNSGIILLKAGVNKLYSLRVSPILKRKNGTNSTAISSFEKAESHLMDYFSFALKNRIANEIEIVVEDKKLVSITPQWNQKLMDDFEKSLPKYLKGKVKSWYIDAKDWKSEPIEDPAEIMLTQKVNSISPREKGLSQEELTEMSLQELLAAFAPYVQESSNPLWDMGMISIEKNAQGIFSGKLTQWYYTDEEAKKNDSEAGYYEKDLKEVTARMKSLFEQLHKVGNPKASWDALNLEFDNEGLHNVTFEYRGEEVSPFT